MVERHIFSADCKKNNYLIKYKILYNIKHITLKKII